MPVKFNFRKLKLYMKYLYFLSLVTLASCSNSYYIVRHAEKEPASAQMTSSDVALSGKGQTRAVALKDILKDREIRYIFSTNFIRTRSTAQPTADFFNLQIVNYGPAPDAAFIGNLKLLRKNVLIVGHSNTVDDIVNMLCGKKEINADLDESEFNNLFIVRKKGKRFYFIKKYYGPSNQ